MESANNIRNTCYGCVSSVGGTERVAYIVVAEVSEFLGKCLAVLGLLRTTETGVLKKNNIALVHSSYSSRCVSTGHVVASNEGNLLAELLGEALSNGSKALTLVGAVLNLAEMRAKDNLCAVVKKLVDRRKSRNNTGLVGDDTVLERNIEIAANKDSLALRVEIVNRLFVQRHIVSFLSVTVHEAVIFRTDAKSSNVTLVKNNKGPVLISDRTPSSIMVMRLAGTYASSAKYLMVRTIWLV